MNRLNPVIPGRVSEELYAASIGKINNEPQKYGRYYNTLVIHLIDSVSRGYTSPMEAYDALNSKYFPTVLTTRRSSYEHLVKE